MEIKSIEQLKEEVLGSVITAFMTKNGVLEQVINKTKDTITEMVYESYDPTMYERTYQLRDSVTLEGATETATSVKYRVAHDTDRIIADIGGNQHYLVNPKATNRDVSKWIPDIVVHNKYGYYTGPGDGQFEGYQHHIGETNKLGETWRRPHPYFEETAKELESNSKITKMLQSELKKLGIRSRIK